ncbi:MAG: hypothetical protein ACK5MK_09210, partial [Dysgonomonas sp.]
IMYPVLFILGTIFLLITSQSTSPLFLHTRFGFDSTMFILMGQSLLDGKTLYMDVFDHKGPILYFIEAFAQILVYGKIGVFIVQIFNMFFSLVLLLKSIRIFTKSAIDICFIFFLFFLFYKFTVSEGNMTEEYCLLLSLLALYTTLRFYFIDNKNISYWKIIILGLCFSLAFWIRPNNAGVTSACFAFIFLVTLFRRNWKLLFKETLLFVSIFIIISALIFAYFYMKAGIQGINDMIFAYFKFNITYAQGVYFNLKSKSYMLFAFICLSSILSLCCGSYFLYKKQKDRNILLLAFLLIIFGILPMCIGRTFVHYLTVILPLMPLGLLLFFASHVHSSTMRKWYPYVFAAVVIAAIPAVVIFRWPKVFVTQDTERIALSIKKEIPVNELSDVFCYTTHPSFYLITGIKPYYKYFAIQEGLGMDAPQIYNDVDSMMSYRKPKWIVTGWNVSEKSDGIYNISFKKAIMKNYSLYKYYTCTESEFWLYKKKDPELKK